MLYASAHKRRIIYICYLTIHTNDYDQDRSNRMDTTCVSDVVLGGERAHAPLLVHREERSEGEERRMRGARRRKMSRLKKPQV
jgi:hypothetical protein